MVLDATQVAGVPSGPGRGPDNPSSTQEAQRTEGGQAGQPAPRQQPSRPSTPASGGGNGQASGDGQAAETGETEQPKPRPITEYTHEQLLEEHPTLRRYVDSRVGDLSQRQARELAEQIAQQRIDEMQSNDQLRRQMEYRRHLRETDPEKFAQYDAEQESRYQTETQISGRERAKASKEFFTGFDNMLFDIQFSLPEAAQNEVAGKTFRDPTGDPWKSRQMYLSALTSAAIKHGVNGSLGSALTQARENITEAARLEANGQHRGSQPTPDTRGGDAPSSEYATQSEFDQFGRGNSSEARAWRKENKSRVEAGMANGRILQ